MEQPPAEKKILPELKFAHLDPVTWEKLKNLERTGWVNRGVKNPESVQDHIIALRELAFEIFSETEEFSDVEKEEILDMLEIHDWPEATNGDPVILTENAEEKKKLKEEKFELELAAMKEICAKLGSAGETIMSLWLRFEKAEDPASLFAHQIDKYQAIEKALEYQKRGEKVLAQDFINYAEKMLSHPLILERLAKIKEQLK